MYRHKFFNILLAVLLVVPLFLGGNNQAQAKILGMPMSPTDESKVPHYFGPNPNWANSPFALPDAEVVITGDGEGAAAEATVGANGVVTSITITNGGRGYSKADVAIVGSGSGASAKATIVKKGALVDIIVDNGGLGYTAPSVEITGNGSGAAASAYGGVSAILLTDPGSGYTMPTVDFDLPDGPDGVQAQGHVTCLEQFCHPASEGASVTITGVVIDSPGSGYSFAPGISIRNGTMFEPRPLNEGGRPASARTSLSISSFTIDSTGADYSKLDVAISDPTGSGAAVTGVLDNGVVSVITLGSGGSGYIAPGGLRKFVDTLPGLGPDKANNLGQYIPVAEPDTTSFANADYYEIAVVEYEEKMHSDLPPTTLRGYVQLETSKIAGEHYALPGGKFGVTKPHYLGPTIVAQKDRAVRITFYNLLPTGSAGDLFIPVDSSMMGSGMGPMEMMMDPMDNGSVMDMVRNPECTKDPKPDSCFADNRATLHLHGGNSPWISDGTPHQWITPAGESTMWPEGVSVVSVPDMVGQAAIDAGIPDCSGPNDGCMTFYYTNQQSARLMFYHDHSWGITRLNVYAGEAAAYLITDKTEESLIAKGLIPGAADTFPLVIQERTFVPQDNQLYNQYDADGNVISYGQDPTWDKDRWGTYGDLWYHHVYMPAQNPGSSGGMSAFGRWMYSPWFWPPQNPKYPPIANPYFDPACDLDDPATWQYQEDPFCEPALIPSTPLVSAGMEQFNDTPVVNGTAYPTVTLDPKSYRFRILNAANDRFWNLQWYVADPNVVINGLNGVGEPIGNTEVALNPAELAAAQLDPVQFPTPLLSTLDSKGNTVNLTGPDWFMIGNEGGFLAAPAVIDGQQHTTWIEDPTRFDAGLVDKHSLLLAPAERADVVVDFSQFAGKTLILYNDAPAAYPARIPSYDYYTGAPDLRPVGAPNILPGYGPNTRTIMQVKIAAKGAAPAYNLNALKSAFSHKADGSGVFESGQPPIIVGQAAYNSAYGTRFVSNGWCNAPTNASSRCDGFARINEQGGDMFKFDTLLGTQVSVKIEPKAIQDETSETSFDLYGRMMGALGVEVVPATPGAANTVLLPYAYPLVEVFDTSQLPKADVTVSPISKGDDGTQIWKITHNGVDTHPIHFHATDVQILNRVTWDNIIKPPEPDELGWKETIRVNPLEDTYVIMRPITPVLPFDFPNSIRLIDPSMPEGHMIADTLVADQMGLPLLGFAPNGEPIDIVNHYVNYGAEYVYHCHILSHEEMDMMHAVTLAYPPVAPDGLAFDPLTMTLSWRDNSLSETAFIVQKSVDGVNWTEIGRVDRLLDPMYLNTSGGVETFIDSAWVVGDQYRVVAQNTVGDTWDYSNPALNEIEPGTYAFPVVTNESVSEVLLTTEPVVPQPPAAPSDLSATQVTGPQVSLAWTDNADNEDSFLVQKSVDGGLSFVDLVLLPAGSTSFLDADVAAGNTYTYQVAAVNAVGMSAFSNTASVSVVAVEPPAPPAAPDELAATLEDGPVVNLVWNDLADNETGFVIERSTDGVNFSVLTTVGANTISYNDATVAGGFTYTYRVAAVNIDVLSAYSPTATVEVPAALTIPAAPSNVIASQITANSLTLSWLDNSNNEAGFTIQIAQDSAFTKKLVSNDVGADLTSANITGLAKNTGYFIRVSAYNAAGASPWSATLNVTTPK